MRTLALFTLVATLAVCADSHTTAAPVPKHLMKEAENPDLAAMQGKWELISANLDGESRKPADATLEIRDNRGKIVDEHSNSTFIFTLDTTTNPRRMISLDSTDRHAKAIVAIYKIEGDTLTIADRRDDPEKPPEEFSGEGITALIYTRVRK